MRKYVAFAALLALPACTTVYEPIRDNAEAWDQAHAECEYRGETASAPHQNAWVAVAVRERLYKSCMRARGWAPR